jgi:GT2 family glycosyltransferase
VAATVSAVIVNYNAGGILRDLAVALLSLPEVARVVVVDNASVDGSPERLADANRDRRFELLRNDVNRGFGAACNQGAARVDSPYLLFINPDCRIEADALQRLLAALRARPDAGMAGPLILNSDGSEQRGCRRYLPDPRRALMRVLGLGGPDAHTRVAGFDLTGTPLPNGVIEMEAISGACMLMSREAYARLGGWDEGYFLHCEDLDLCMRLKLLGLKLLFVPDAVVTHAQGVSSRGRNLFVLWHKHRGMWRYFGKFQRQASPPWLTALVWLGIWSRFLLLLPGAWLASLGHRAVPDVG